MKLTMKPKTCMYLGRNPNWESLSAEENKRNKKLIDGYIRIFKDGTKKVFKYKNELCCE
ncbi:MAG: hypothetical protein QXV85_10755 [Candidatus Bathyarchaeia archaeon]